MWQRLNVARALSIVINSQQLESKYTPKAYCHLERTACIGCDSETHQSEHWDVNAAVAWSHTILRYNLSEHWTHQGPCPSASHHHHKYLGSLTYKEKRWFLLMVLGMSNHWWLALLLLGQAGPRVPKDPPSNHLPFPVPTTFPQHHLGSQASNTCACGQDLWSKP